MGVAGIILDNYLVKTKPMLTISGVMLGLIAGIFLVVIKTREE